jgi:hypothetical protein
VVLSANANRSFTWFVSAFAIMGLVNEKSCGGIKLEEIDEEYSDALLPGIEKLEKM